MLTCRRRFSNIEDMKKCFLSILSLITAGAAFAAAEAVIDASKTYQTIRSFGAADAWSANFAAQWEDCERNKIADLLFSTETDKLGNPKGIGLTIWRVNLGAGTWEQGEKSQIKIAHKRAESFLSADGKSYDWNKCAGQQWLMREAKKRGCDKFLLFVNSPVVSMTINGRGFGEKTGKSNLKPECYDAFADYVADVAKHFIGQNLNIAYISPINEPQWLWDKPLQEGCSYLNSEAARLIRSLDRALGERKLEGVKMIICESERIANLYELEFARKPKKSFNFPDNEIPGNQIRTFFDKNSPHYVGGLKYVAQAVNSHSYDSDKTAQELKKERAPLAAILDKYGIEFHSSEFITLPSIRKKSDVFEKNNPSELGEALHLARVIHADLTLTPAVTWQNWKAIEVYNCGGRGLINLFPKTEDITKGGYVLPSKLLWAMGNFSRFVRPGYKRVSMGGFEDVAQKTFGSAWISPDAGTLVVVCENISFENAKVALKLPQEFSNASVSAYETSERMDLAKIPVADKNKIDVAARSVTTFVFKK